MRLNAKIERIAQSDHRRAAKCVEAGCDQLATYVVSDQEIANGLLLAPAQRLHCRRHAEQFAAEHRIPMPS
jgi:hypothetical protein